MPYPPELLQLVDKCIHLANELAEGGMNGGVSAAILFAAGRYNTFNILSHNGNAEDSDGAVEFYISEYRKALTSNSDGVAVVRAQV